MCLVIAIRAASICRFVTYECSTAWMPYSPKATLVPPLAAPDRSGLCCLRCRVLRGMSIPQPSSPVVACAPGAVLAALAGSAALSSAGRPRPAVRTVRSWPPPAPRRRGRRPVPAARALPGAQAGRGRLALGSGLRGVAAVDPDLHADPAERGAGLVEAVVDVGAQRVQRNP